MYSTDLTTQRCAEERLARSAVDVVVHDIAHVREQLQQERPEVTGLPGRLPLRHEALGEADQLRPDGREVPAGVVENDVGSIGDLIVQGDEDSGVRHERPLMS